VHPLEVYFSRLRDISGAGIGQHETSYYDALATLLTAYGRKLNPRVTCVMQIRNQGAGIPDGGLFTAEQLRGHRDRAERVPSRGVIEAKAFDADVERVSQTEQVRNYLGRYGLVLVTNFREFLLLELDRNGNPRRVDALYRFAASEESFAEAIGRPRALAERYAPTFDEFIQRGLLHNAPLAAPADLAHFLASFAREAKARVELAGDIPAIRDLRVAFSQALGMIFQDEEGERFFRSSLVQTLFYGIFSAWVLWHKQHPVADEVFHWQEAIWTLRVPMINVLYAQIAQPAALEPLGLVEVLDWTAETLNRVEYGEFFRQLQHGDAVQYFYEPFLEEFDPDLRKQLGVWYTPREVVRYMVGRIDQTLRSELGIQDGFADERVIVLDPCCGTGAFLVEVLHRIDATLRANGVDALRAHRLKQAAGKIFGFEILPAPFVISHLQLGLLLQELDAPFEENERAAVFLTNALTGWTPPAGPQQQLMFAQMQQELDRADDVKQRTTVLVIVGNPPYNGFAGIAVGEERELSTAYRTTIRVARPEGHGLNELYIRFFRVAERKIVERSQEGVVCYISNYSWLDSKSCPGMRERYLDAFDSVWIDSLNGDAFSTGKTTPDGAPDPSIFSTEANPEGIQVGTAISLLVRKREHAATTAVHYREFWGVNKRQQLVDAMPSGSGPAYKVLQPGLELRLPFTAVIHEPEYLNWPLLVELLPRSFPGVKTSRDDLVVHIERAQLLARMCQYFDPDVPNQRIAEIAPRAMKSGGRFDAPAIRAYLVGRGMMRDNFVPFCYRPFDVRWLYWEPETKLLDERREEYYRELDGNSLWIAAAKDQRRKYDPPVVTRRLASLHVIERGASLFPTMVHAPQSHLREVEANAGGRQPNMSPELREYIRRINGSTFEDVFFHIVATLYCPAYRQANSGALQHDWPRIPMPSGVEELRTSAALGRNITALLDPEVELQGVTVGAAVHLRAIAEVATSDGTQIEPARDLVVSENWGYVDARGAVMPGLGATQLREMSVPELAALERLSEAQSSQIGVQTMDVHINAKTYWRNVPAPVWDFSIGGYPVLKKWLSYRDQRVLNRALQVEELEEFQKIARRITSILLLNPQLDAAYNSTIADAVDWPSH
jgi:hypothetical protein